MIVRKIKGFLENPRKIFMRCTPRSVKKRMSDREYLSLLYWVNMGKKLRLDPPVTFNEKLQWLKLYDRKPIYTTMVDKYEAKKYVAERIGEEYIIPTLGVWDSFDEIDFDSLPEQFVLKCTHDSGGLVICRDKNKIDMAAARSKIERSLRTNYYWSNKEWPYKNVKPRIIAEAFMEDPKQSAGLRDYKFYCFNGEPKCLYVSEGLENHETARISFLNLDWSFTDFRRNDFAPFEQLPPKPNHYEIMLSFAQQLSREVPFLRVDLYEINGKVYFSELTFSPCSGMMPFEPVEWDEVLGNWIKLPEKTDE